MRLTEQDLIRASKDEKFMAARWKQRVAVSQARLDNKIRDGKLGEKEIDKEMRMHKSRIKKMREYEKKVKLNN